MSSHIPVSPGKAAVRGPDSALQRSAVPLIGSNPGRYFGAMFKPGFPGAIGFHGRV